MSRKSWGLFTRSGQNYLGSHKTEEGEIKCRDDPIGQKDKLQEDEGQSPKSVHESALVEENLHFLLHNWII